MNEYHKIDTVFKRDPADNFKTLIIGDFARDSFAYLAGCQWIWTEKVDGTNIRVMVSADGDVTFGGKTDAAMLPAFLVTVLERRFATTPQRALLREIFPDGGCLYGEGYGAKIQKGGGNYRPDQDFVLFDVKVGPWWLKRDAVHDVAAKLGVDRVPVIGEGTLGEMVDKARAGFKSTWGDFHAEGIVARPSCELVERDGKRIITKIKHRDFGAAKSKKELESEAA